jgi:excisionase family DNA binding protein
MTRRAGPRAVRIHRSYSVEEAAKLLHVHKNTVREWLRHGLPAIDQRRPLLILGRELASFLDRRRRANKRPCAPGQIYCVRCRCPQAPAGSIADYLPMTATVGDLIGMCPVCDALMYRRVSLLRLGEVRGNLNVQLPVAMQRIDESRSPSVNHDFARE